MALDTARRRGASDDVIDLGVQVGDCISIMEGDLTPPPGPFYLWYSVIHMAFLSGSSTGHKLRFQVVAIVVLVILITAPLGAALTALTGPRLLRTPKERHLVDGEKMDLTWDDQLEYSSELSKMNVNIDEHGRMDITTERETVT